jgi:hypothetical protein
VLRKLLPYPSRREQQIWRRSLVLLESWRGDGNASFVREILVISRLPFPRDQVYLTVPVFNA